MLPEDRVRTDCIRGLHRLLVLMLSGTSLLLSKEASPFWVTNCEIHSMLGSHMAINLLSQSRSPQPRMRLGRRGTSSEAERGMEGRICAPECDCA